MNRQERRALRYTIEDMATKILREEQSWSDRWDAYCGCCQGAQQFPGISPEGLTEFVGLLARTVVDRLKAQPIGGVHQMLFYFTSSDPAHRAASFVWQKANQAALVEPQAANPYIRKTDRDALPGTS
jgi:hypothetical protein